jgi:hypothetical protein
MASPPFRGLWRCVLPSYDIAYALDESQARRARPMSAQRPGFSHQAGLQRILCSGWPATTKPAPDSGARYVVGPSERLYVIPVSV